ncbi:hypothetical protein CAPTEDRAFT_209575, partial [Capitella teleta]
MPSQKVNTDSSGRVILLLSDCWSNIRDGIAGINKSLAQSLAMYKGIRLYSAVFTEASKLSQAAIKEASESNVILFSLASNGTSSQELYKSFNADPCAYLSDLKERIPNVHQIVGHVPVTGRACLAIRDQLYPQAKVVLFFHIVPQEISWLGDNIPFDMLSESELVNLGEQADFVYSITEKLHWFNTAKFRNRAKQSVDHHLFLPQCSKEVFSITREKQTGKTPTILVMADGRAVDPWLGLDIAACAVNK